MAGQLQEILIWGNVLKLQADMAAASIAPAVSCSSFFKSQTFDPELGLRNILCGRVIWKVALSSLCLWPPFTPYPLFQWYLKSKDILLNMAMKY
jgi:hypothetical protein